jgi:hypothetical protein
MAVECKRSQFQSDSKSERVSVRVTADKPKSYQPSEKPALLVDLPTKVGEYPLSGLFNVTAFLPPSRNIALINGTLVIYQASDSSIEFGLTARGLDGNEVNGRMVADISPNREK